MGQIDSNFDNPMLCPMKRGTCSDKCAWSVKMTVPTYPSDETFMACAVAVIANYANDAYGIPVRRFG